MHRRTVTLVRRSGREFVLEIEGEPEVIWYGLRPYVHKAPGRYVESTLNIYVHPEGAPHTPSVPASSRLLQR